MENLVHLRNPCFLCPALLLLAGSAPVVEMWAKPPWILMENCSGGSVFLFMPTPVFHYEKSERRTTSFSQTLKALSTERI